MKLPTLSQPPRTAWVSGATSGLGAALVRTLLEQDVRVWGTARRPERLEAFATNREFTPVRFDLEERETAIEAYRAADEQAGGFDLVIHNAGYGVFGPFAGVASEQWQRQLGAMVDTVVQLNHLGFSRMVGRRRGALVNVSSVAVEYPLPFMAGYNVAKAALSALSESLMFEARGTPVCVIDFRPADLRTDFNRSMRVPECGATLDPRLPVAWRHLEQNLARAPGPERAVRDLWRALERGKSATVYSGGFFQAQLAPLFARLAPARLRRAVAARYFGVS
ncbi:SDR family NAD(P)-dependent oxidoreductase [Nibricoccus sp. IMCC34717]|uniref:SDR family NAD(P)-dependent oxidoreductase n=1 Tax=Nibricoccus sp. IMCC34717 TaxID=3034021 RepID=UPI00384CF6EA